MTHADSFADNYLLQPALIDIGVNLASERFHDDLDAVLFRAKQVGVVAQLITGSSIKSSETAAALACAHQNLYATAGIHPHDAASFNADSLAQLTRLAASPKVRAIGETGLDFNRDFSPRPLQEKAFAAQLELAITLKMPVFLHQRDAHQRFYPLLKEYRGGLARVLVHCFTGSRQELFDYLDLGCSIGITGWLCDKKRGADLRELVKDIPDDRIMIETDAPYLLPHNLKAVMGIKPVRKGRCEPAFLPAVLQQLAACRDQDATQLAAHCLANSLAFMGLTESDLAGA